MSEKQFIIPDDIMQCTYLFFQDNYIALSNANAGIFISVFDTPDVDISNLDTLQLITPDHVGNLAYIDLGAFKTSLSIALHKQMIVLLARNIHKFSYFFQSDYAYAENSPIHHCFMGFVKDLNRCKDSPVELQQTLKEVAIDRLRRNLKKYRNDKDFK